MKQLEKRDYDAIVVGSGPNGLAAAITLQRAGVSVLLVEAKDTIGGGLRSAELTLPGYIHDVCSAIHPMAAGSPFFSSLPLHDHGLEFITPTYAAAHPFDTGDAAILYNTLEETASSLGQDASRYRNLISPLVKDFDPLMRDILGPLSIPSRPLLLARFGLSALQPATLLGKSFATEKARSLWAGMAAHAMLPLEKLATAAIGLVLMSAAHAHGWPLPRAGSGSIAKAMLAHFTSLGGKVMTNFHVRSLNQLPGTHAVLFDTTPRQLLEIAGHTFSSVYKHQLQRYAYGMGVFKVDWALDGPIPFQNPLCREAGTIHIGNTLAEIAVSEKQTWQGKHAEKPFVLLAQQSIFDTSRAPEGKHTAWGYCHVPHSSTVDMTDAIEKQIERFAPGFRDRILARNTMNTEQLQGYNPNYIGGDINGGAATIDQLFTRPALRSSPYRTSSKGLYICSSSTPPGGGVHGMSGYHAARRALRDIFNRDAIL
jgi:phytoene dehydrogenase-like protein